jgi:hypothetical protein
MTTATEPNPTLRALARIVAQCDEAHAAFDAGDMAAGFEALRLARADALSEWIILGNETRRERET